MNPLLTTLLLPAFLSVPQPSIVPKSWDLTFYYEDPQQITLRLPGEDRPQHFWYLLYTAVNDTGQDRNFYPSFEVMTGNGRRIPNGVGIHPEVFERIKTRHARSHPFLMSHTQILGTLRQTEDHAVEGVAIWPDFSATSSKFTIYVGGLSGESLNISNPGYDPNRPEEVSEKLSDGTSLRRTVNPRAFMLHKTLQIEYDLPGDARTRATAKPVRNGQSWIMR